MIKKLKDLQGGYKSKVELVELESKKYVLRTSNLKDILNEKYFQKIQAENNLSHLKVSQNDLLAKNQILLEYIEGSPTLANFILCDLKNHKSKEKIVEWGRQLRKIHDIKYEKIFSLDDKGLNEFSWEESIEHEIEYGKSRQIERNGGLEKDVIERICSKIRKLKNYKPNFYCLIHCDPHENNILMRGEEMIFFDKQSEFVSGDPLFDTAVIALSFVGGVEGLEEFGDSCHKENLEAFIDGYGIDFREHPFFTEFLLMRCLTRHPNPFTQYLGEILKKFV